MTSFALAWRTAKRYRARTLLAIAGVAVIGALLFDMLLLSRGLLLSFADLPKNAQSYVRALEEMSGAPFSVVGVGPGRDQTIVLRDLV